MAPRLKKARIASTPLHGNDSSEAVVHVKQTAIRPILQSYPDLLHDLLDPMTNDEFLNRNFRKSAVHVTVTQEKDREQRIAKLRARLFDLDSESILQHTASDTVFVWLRNTTTGLIQSIAVADLETALALHRAGHATYCRAPPSLERLLVGALLENTGLGCGQYDPTGSSLTSLGRGEVEVFQGTAGHVPSWHTDFQENFTVQLSGVKRWRLQKGSVTHPLRGCTPHYRSPSSVEPQLKAARMIDKNFQFAHPKKDVNAVGEVEEVVLRPGDVLYFPAGMWHQVVTEEPGVSLNISLMATNYAALTCQALQHVLLQKSSWRECVTRSVSTSNGSQSISVIEHLKSLLQALPDIVREFEAGGGAQSILPPCLHYSKFTKLMDKENRIEADNGSMEEESDDSSATLEELPVLEPPFEIPAEHSLTRKAFIKRLETHTLRKNPLAVLARYDEITRFYNQTDHTEFSSHVRREEDDSDENQIPDDQVYVLNVNFAGNEGQESLIRVLIRNTDEFLCSLYGNVSNRVEIDDGALESKNVRNVLDCLIYYGYLVWV
ncbi:predicted protein [Phaeodactylum tricornutum CCAP 1055/1]|uniref:JmjC domain-containing protein n=1 Tax=Phaeodactylum tricornutum (strain CCAP 1055/1) TaxID=556484 RepID=B5Y4L3_PHATC|nr:predicted protein [Phaeodactylum tricornutum CCAP 1055/1]ACI65782.1 predicted protein [Phaeodactylum tricornutum CCAP 1055/1]|eukprot:XP_002186312.1 predicted protein [Phaeodactylum tricornutum CCAP 1055/1]